MLMHIQQTDSEAITQLKDKNTPNAKHESPGKNQKNAIQAKGFNGKPLEPIQSKQSKGPIQAKGFNGQPLQPVQRKTKSNGLPHQLKANMEQMSGVDLSDVTVQRNSDKPAQLQAEAYAQGSDIHLAPGKEQHLPHEAWHVVQQKQGRVQPTFQANNGVGINDHPGLEKEADVMGAKAQQGPMAESGLPIQAKQSTNGVIQAKNPKKYPFTASVYKAKSLNLRNSPEIKKDNKIGAFRRGTSVKVLTKSGNWFKVQGTTIAGDLKKGYVSSKYISSDIHEVNKMTSSISADMNEMWDNSFNDDGTVVEEWGGIVVEKGGTQYIKNKRTDGDGGQVSFNENLAKDETQIGNIHTHPYSKSEGSETGVAFSSADISILRNNLTAGFSVLVEAGTRRFSLRITDLTKARAFFKKHDATKIDKLWNDGFKKGKGSFQENVVGAVYNVIGKNEVNGIAFYGTFDKNKVKYDQM